MILVKCYNCKRDTEIKPPKFRCGLCNYPLHELANKPTTAAGPGEVKTKDKAPKPIGTSKSKPGVQVYVGEQASPESRKNISLSNSTSGTDNTEIFNSNKHKNLLRELKLNLEQIKQKSEKQKNLTGEVIVKTRPKNHKMGKVVAGWLVIHTENKAPITYELYVGDNVIGRYEENSKIEIKIDTDPFVSREHCNIIVYKDFLHRFHYELIESDGGSTNGTFINGNQSKLGSGEKVFLADGDTIQVGETKLVFKNTNQSVNFEDAASNVLDKDYTKTVAIKM